MQNIDGKTHLYIGDAVYAAYDELMDTVELRLNAHDDNTHRIVLEREVLANFVDFVKAVRPVTFTEAC